MRRPRHLRRRLRRRLLRLWWCGLRRRHWWVAVFTVRADCEHAITGETDLDIYVCGLCGTTQAEDWLLPEVGL